MGELVGDCVGELDGDGVVEGDAVGEFDGDCVGNWVGEDEERGAEEEDDEERYADTAGYESVWTGYDDGSSNDVYGDDDLADLVTPMVWETAWAS